MAGTPDWFPRWSECAIVASGPSAAKTNVASLRGRMPVLAINTSYQLAPWADVLYACDARWWRLYKGAPDFPGLKITQDDEALKEFPQLRKVVVERYSNSLLTEAPGVIGAGGNGGFQAINLVVQFGAKKIILIGYDMRVDQGGHWHKPHPPPFSNPHPSQNLPRWRKAIDGIAKTLKMMGVEVINCSSVSMLDNYPKKTLEEALRV